MTELDVVTLQDVEDYACKFLPKSVLDYYKSGADEEQTYRDNREAFKRWILRPRILRDVSVLDTSTTILGRRLPYPIAIAPSAMHRMAHPDGELATARASAAQGVGMVLSTFSTSSIEEVAEAAGPDGTLWFQLYFVKDLAINRDLVLRAERAGYKGIFLTVDVPTTGKRIAPIRSKFQMPPHLRLANFDAKMGVSNSETLGYISNLVDPSLNWEHVKWLKSITSLPIILKGVLTAEAAREAVAHGVAGVVVSNHGGRQLDGVPATIDALPEVVEAVRGSGVEVYMDGGVRTGTDVLKALSLGARAVFVGQPAIWALAYDGEAGVKKMLQILTDEFRTAMALVGAASISDLNKSLVRRQGPSFSSKL